MSIEEHMAVYEQQGVDHKEAMKLVAKDGASASGMCIRHCLPTGKIDLAKKILTQKENL